ncbi:MAG: type IV toxin-antitoxin system AbiEi family antitoxin domain-containing protein [Jiangellaceae bacterium]
MTTDGGLPPPLLELLEFQAGAVSARQLSGLGLRRRFAEDRVSSGRWQRTHRGVYVAFSGPVPRLTRIWAGVLRAGPGSAASHETAAELDGLCELRDPRVHVTAPVSRRILGPQDGLVIHYAHRLPASRHPTKDPPRTRLEDTVLDLVDSCRVGREVEGWVTAACQRRLTAPERLAESLATRSKISWRPMVEAMLLDVAAGAQSPFELTYLRRVERAHGLPAGDRQVRWAGRRVIWIDVDYNVYRTRVELDGRLGHVGDGRFRDRRRDNRAAVARTWSLRYGFAETFGSACDVAAEVAIVLRDRGWRGAPTACGNGCPIGLGLPDRDAWAAS